MTNSRSLPLKEIPTSDASKEPISSAYTFIPPAILNDIPKLESKEYLIKRFSKSPPKPRNEKKHIRFNSFENVQPLDASDNLSHSSRSADASKKTNPSSKILSSPYVTNSNTQLIHPNLEVNSKLSTSQYVPNSIPRRSSEEKSEMNLHSSANVHQENHKNTLIEDKKSSGSSQSPSQVLVSSANLHTTSESSFTPEIGTYKISALASIPPAPPPPVPRAIHGDAESSTQAPKKGSNLKSPISVFTRLKTYLDPETSKNPVYAQLYQNRDRPLFVSHSPKPSTPVLFAPSTMVKEELIGAGQPSRKNIIVLREKMHSMLQKIDALKLDHAYPPEIQNLLNLAQQENLIFDTVFQEVIRHVTMNLFERGELLVEIRQRYLNMFQQIPKIVEATYSNYVAQCFINKKLKKEIIRVRDELAGLTSLLTAYKDLNQKLLQDTDYKQMLEDFIKAEHVDDILNEYQIVYRWQRTRMEEHIKRVELEKKVWVDAATCLSLRIATDHGLPDVAQLQRYEYGRIRAANHINAILQTHYGAKGKTIEAEMNNWLQRLSNCSHEIQKRDKKCIQLLTRTMREMKQFVMMLELETNELEEMVNLSGVEEARKNPSVETAIQLEELSISNLHLNLKQWVEQINDVSTRYTSERDERILSELSLLQKNIQTWLDPCLSILRKAQKTESGSVYMNLQYELNDLKSMLDGWLEHLKIRLTGDDGLASQIISLQNTIEDKYTSLASKLQVGATTQEEKLILYETVTHWNFQLNAVCSEYLNGSSSTQENRLPMQTGLWLAKLMDQLSTENELQKEDNFRLHNSVVHWMVQLLMKTGLQPPDESWDAELEKLHANMNSKIVSLLRNCGGIELLSDDKKDLKEVIQFYADSWYETAQKLLEKEKKNTLKLLKKRKKQGLAVPTLIGKAMELSKASELSDCVDEEGNLLQDAIEEEDEVDEENDMIDDNELEEESFNYDEENEKGAEVGHEKEKQVLGFDSTYLEAGQDGKGSYPDASVRILPIEKDA